MPPPPNWIEITQPEFAWEREAIEFLQSRFPRHAPYRAWSNFEFLDASGRLYDVDALLVGPKGVFLVEVKSWPGRIAGDSHTLTWTDPEGRARTRDHPYRLVNQKAKALKSQLERTGVFRHRRVDAPYFAGTVFLSDPELRVDVDEAARTALYGRGTSERRTGIPDVVAELIDVASADHERLRRRGRIDRPTSEAFAEAMQQAGIRPSNRMRTVGEYRLGELLAEGPGYQDFAGEHETVSARRRRVRIYAAPQRTDDPQRVRLRRAARREAELLEGLRHPAILQPQSFLEHDLGPALVLDADPEWPSLDLWLADAGPRLTVIERLELIRTLADAIRYAHDHGVSHRALSPRSVLVAADRDAEIRLRVGDWGTGAARDAVDSATVAGTRDIEALADPAAGPYMAPELLVDAAGDAVLLDVFSLGAIAYLVLTGRPPAERAEDLPVVLRESGGLDLAAAMDGVGSDLRELVRSATAPVVTERLEDVDAFLFMLDEAVQELLRAVEHAADADPTTAKPGDRISQRLTLVRQLGRGSTALAMLVEDAGAAGQRRVLKVPLDAAREQAIRDEGEVLAALRHPAIAELYEVLHVGERPCLLMQWASGGTLARRLREEGPLPLELLERFGTDLLEALRQLEREGYVHRDVKPENLGIVPVGKNDERHLMLFDFSLSRADPAAVLAGTPQYLDPFLPERGRFDPAADRYAAAVTLHEMATGRRPQWGDGRTNPASIRDEVTVAGEAIDPAVRAPLGELFSRALRRDAAERFDTAEDLLSAWRAAFAQVDQPALAGPERVDAAEREALLAAARPETPLSAVGLTSAQVAALERHNIVLVEDLVLLPGSELTRLRGVGNRMRRELAQIAGRLRRLLAAELADRARAASTATTDDGELEAVLALDAIVEQLLPARARDQDQLELQRALLLPATGDRRWPAPDAVARDRDVPVTAVRAALEAGIRRWSKAPAITEVRRIVAGMLDAHGGVAAAEEVAAHVLAARGALAQDGDRRLALARAVTRAALEVELAREAEARFSQRRVGDRLLLATRATDAQALLDYALALGEAADALAAEDPPMAPALVAERLAEVPLPRELPALAPARRLAVAARAGATAAVSSRGELYLRGMAASRALALAQGALVGASELSIEELRSRVAARYPDAQPLPADARALEALLAENGIDLTWRTDPGRRDGGVFAPAALPLGVTGLASTSTLDRASTVTTSGRAPLDVEALEAADAERHLQSALSEGGLLAILSAPSLLRAARRELMRRFDLREVNLDAAVVGRMREICTEQGIDWTLVSRTDGEGPEGQQWPLLQRLVGDAVDATTERLLETPGVVLMRGLGVLTRYGRLDVLARLRDDARARPLLGWWLLVPDGGGAGPPALDGHAIPVVTPADWLRLPPAWIENRHRGEVLAA